LAGSTAGKISPQRQVKNKVVQTKNKKNEVPSSKTVLIVNPTSCSGLTGKGWDTLFPKIRETLRADPEVVFTKKAGDGTAFARDFLRKGYTTIVALGGDGTLNEVANGFFEEPVGIHGRKYTKSHRYPSPFKLKPINPDASFTIVPCGTRNVLAKSLGLPEDAVECCRQAFSLGAPRDLDVISVAATKKEDGSAANTRVFLNAAEIGLAAEIIDRSKQVRKTLNSRLVSTITSVLSTLPTYLSNESEISIEDGKKKFIAKMTMAAVANGPFLGGGFKVAPLADMSDGLLDIVIVRDSGSFKLLDELVSLKQGDYSNEDNIFYTQARKISMISKERDVTVTIDGEPIGILPATFEIIPKALRVRL
jgi:YegS/Rv2252/BmrU family lipid kinase